MNEPRLTAPPSDEQSLIALIENKPPEELTLGEIEALRVALPHSPELQRVLSRHIQMDQYLADALGRLSVSVDEILARAAQVAPRGRRGMALGWAFGVLFLLAGVGGFLLVSGLANWHRAAPPVALKNEPSKAPQPSAPAAAKSEKSVEKDQTPAERLEPSKVGDPAQPSAASLSPAKVNAALPEPAKPAPASPAEKPTAEKPTAEKPTLDPSKPEKSATGKSAPEKSKPEKPKPEKPTSEPPTVNVAVANKPVASNDGPSSERAPASGPIELSASAAPVVRPSGPWDGVDQLNGPILKATDAASAFKPRVVEAAQLEHLRDWFEAVPGANYQLTVDAQQATLQGLARLKAPWDEHALLRLELGSQVGARIHLWHGDQGVAIYAKQPAPDMTWAAATTTRQAAAALPDSYALTSTDSGRAWRTGDNGPAGPTRIDIRYERGQVVVARGEVALLSAPLAGPPQEIYFEGRALLRDVRMLRGEPLAAENVAPRSIELSYPRPATAKWETELTPSARLDATPTGQVTLASSGSPSVQHASIKIAPRGLREFIFEVSDFTSGAGIFVGDERGQPLAQARFFRDQNSKSGQLALGYPPLTDQTWQTPLDFNSALHPFAARRAWIRVLACGGRIRYWLSSDGQNWAQLGQPQRLPTHDIRSVGILCGPFQQPSSITLDKLEVRGFTALDELGPWEWVDIAPTILVDNLPAWLERVLESQPAELGVNADQWRAACAVRSLAAGLPMPLAGRVSQLLLQDALALAPDDDARWQALQTIAHACDCWSKGEGSLDWGVFEKTALGWANRALAEGDPLGFRSTFPRLVALPAWTTDSDKLPLAELARQELLALVATQRWPEIRRATNRLVAYGYLGHQQQNLQLAATSVWANASAVELGAEAPVDENASVLDPRWRHPLSIELSKEGFNVLAELEVALANRAFKDACQIVATTRGAGSFGLLPSGKDPRLWSSFPLAVSDTMRRYPEMQRTMREQYGQVGLLRVKQSMTQADDQSLELATVQFYGTPAAALAHFWLGDRNLAAGDFVRAIRHYDQADIDAEAGLKSQIHAHRRLASAMAGEPWGTKVSGPVQMGDEQMPAHRFESLVEEMLQRRPAPLAASPEPLAAQVAAPQRFGVASEFAPAPPPTALATSVRGQWEQIAGVPPGAAQQSAQTAGVDWVARGFAGLIDQQRLYFTDGAQVSAWNLKSANGEPGSLAWRVASAGPGGSSQQLGMFPLRPVMANGLLVARRRIQQGYGIIALKADTGELAWQAEGQRDNAFQYPAISDPLAWSDEILTLIAEPVGKHALVSLAAFDSSTGELRRKSPAAFFGAAWQQYQTCSIILQGDAVLATLGGSVLCLDPLGEVRWIRRQSWISPDIALDWATRDARPPTVHGEQMFLAGVGVTGLECLELSTGKLLWKQPLCDAQRVVGVERGVLVVETATGLAGFEAASGEPRWRHEASQRLDGILIGGPGQLAYARKSPAREPNQFHPQMVWLNPATGQAVARATLWGLTDANPGFGPIFHSEGKMWVLFGRGAQQLTRELVEITPHAEGPAVAMPVSLAESAPLLRRWAPEISPRLMEAVETVAPEWTILQADAGPQTGLLETHEGRPQVLALKPAGNQPTRLARLVHIPESGKTLLKLSYAAHPGGACVLLARVGDTTLWRKKISGAETSGAWQETEIDLSPYAGLDVWIQLQQAITGQPNDELFLSGATIITTP